MGWLIVLLVLIGIFVVPFVISNYLAKSLRVPDAGFGMGVILSSLLAAGTIIFAALQPEQELTHTVVEGETLREIAKKYDDVSMTELVNLNNIKSPDELPETLKIPNPKSLEIKRGVDLSGGVILIYEIDEELSRESAGGADKAGEKVNIDALVEALARRINPGGVKEIVIRPYGDKQVEIIIPDVDAAEVERIKRQITKAGFLRFLIVAKRADHPALFALAEAQPNARVLRNGAESLGEWVRIATTEEGDLKVNYDPRINKVRELQPGVVEILMAHDLYRVEGKHLRTVSKGFDDRMQPAVNFSMGSEGARLFGGLTSVNLPDSQSNRQSRLGIIMDNELISAPVINERISDRGQISGRFTDEEVEELINVLRAGRLPAVLKSEPITENQIDPLLGADTIDKGRFAIGASLIAVLVFMVVYYRFAGLVACFALLLNLVLILALMILIRAAFTLPGLAGLVLTVGMSVDANVLIFERIREELKRGSALRLAIRNGFSRATSTIVDANLTTLITALVLYGIGKDQLRGFAVTLILGILMSMFTAIFCSRVIFELAERRRWIKNLTMMQLLDAPNLNLIGMRKLGAMASIVLIVIGIGGVAARQAGIFDIDFLGGTSVQARLKAPMSYDGVRERLDGISDDLSLTQVKSDVAEDDTIWKIDTSLEDNKELQHKLAERFQENGESLFVSHTMDFTTPTPVENVVVPESESTDASEVGADTVGITPPSLSAGGSNDDDSAVEAESDPVVAEPEASDQDGSDSEMSVEEGSDSTEEPTEPATEAAPPVDESSSAEVDAEADAGEGVENVPEEPAVEDSSRTDLPSETLLAQADISLGLPPASNSTERCQATLKFGQRVTRDTLVESFQAAAEKAGVNDPPIDLTGPHGEADSAAGFRDWTIVANTTPEELTTILTSMKVALESEPAWLSSSKIGGKVAGDTQLQAIAAILVSLVGIVGYLWVRFHRVIYGLSAVAALVHDVLITLGAIALSLYLSKVFGFLLVDEFKISLPVVAAFLTIIGYSLNDTIVVFDRIREVKGRSPDLTEEMINTSINQTLSRTILTSMTTLLVVLILYAFGGQGIHGFAFALLVGVVVGTYSSIFVASPALLWMSQMQGTDGKKVVAENASSN